MEAFAINIVLHISLFLEIMAALIIGSALIRIFIPYLISFFKVGNRHIYTEFRVSFASSIALSLELLLGADVLETAIAPTWNDIGKLAAIAAIRTLLNYFL